MVACATVRKIFYFNPTTQVLVGWPSGGITFDATAGGSAIPTSGAAAITWLPGQTVPTFLCNNRTYVVTNSFTQYQQIAAAGNTPSGGLNDNQAYTGPIAVLAP